MDEGAPPRGRCGAAGLHRLQGPGTVEPVGPELGATGKTIFVLDEYYDSPAGIARHWQDAMDNWPDLSAVMAWSAKVTVATLHNGTAVQALW